MKHIVLFGAGRMAAAFAEVAAAKNSSVADAMLQASANADCNMALSAIASRSRPEWLSGRSWYPDLESMEDKPDLLVDFSLPDGTIKAARWCGRNGVALLSGVTGLQAEQHAALAKAADSVAVMWSPNLSLGVNLLANLAQKAISALPENTSVNIDDVHHRHKQDAPSGTALMLGDSICSSRPGLQGQIVYSSRREGEVIGQHEIVLEWAGERLVLGHEAMDRAIFARGAWSAAEWLLQQPAGQYTAADWLA
jgi:4-hydroxy-tetrahydrodipicolinate reductase